MRLLLTDSGVRNASIRTALTAREKAVRTLLATPLVGADGLAEQFPRPTKQETNDA